MRGSLGLPIPDPYAFPDLGISGGTGYYYVNNIAPRWNPIDPAKKTLVFLSAPTQSNRSDYAGNLYAPINTANIDQLNINDGALYPISATQPMVGCSLNSNAGSNGGNILAYVADKLIASGVWDRVIVVPLGITNSSIDEWATKFHRRVGVAMRRLADRGITPSTTGVYWAMEAAIGETDVSAGTSQAAWQNSFNNYVTAVRGYGYNGRIFVALESYVSGSTSSTIRAAQQGVVDNILIFPGGDTDTIGSAGRPQDNIHLTTGTVPPLSVLSTGPSDAATLIVAAMHASGSPF